MKINSIPQNNIVESYNGKKTERPQIAGSETVADRVEISDEAKSFASLISEVKSRLEEADTAGNKRIEQISGQVENGTYRVDSSKIAEKILGGNIDISI